MNLDSKVKIDIDIKRINDYFLGSFRNFSLKQYEIPLKNLKILEIVNAQVESSMLPIGKKRDLNYIIKEVNLKDFSDIWRLYYGKILSINYYSSELVNSIMKTSDYLSYIDDICSGTVEYFAYM